ncbi:hypothetical protein BKA70DRAFT_9070 [Coprinopsis sp. MPI-PUGE-AT-0042]|nr:hypothetical protein BKA70DRAFT_1292441 [Coprinopsis sp. MPI-PUGE-AT-0042]KAH6918123.1 hypothetical protein BKA70DRAFT_9070 [Coprinopsis sp. MPI-PUGE-AT-0042]
MPANNQRAGKGDETYVPLSSNAIYQSYGGWPNFMHSHGLKPWDQDDVEEGRQIVDKLKEYHRLDWEEEQRNKQSGR